MSKKQYYAVLRGRRPGIYAQWGGEEGAEAQVQGFAGARYKGFASREQAEYFFKTGGEEMQDHLFDSSAEPGGANRPGVRRDVVQDHRPDLAEGKVVIFTDGASTGNPGPGGYGAVMLFGETRKELSGGFRCTTNNRMELTAVIAALETLKRRSNVVLYSDSRYVVDGIEKGWARRWKTRGWMRDATNLAENSDLWARLLDLLDQHAVEFRWVRGHASHPENERCDRMAVQAARHKNLPPDPGFAC